MSGRTAAAITEMAEQMRADSEYWFPKWHDGTLPLPIAYALGLAGEVGEVANEVKKMHRDGRSDGEGLGPELADVLTYLLLLADDLGIDIAAEYEEKRLANLARWGSRSGNHTWDTVPVGHDVPGSGVIIDKTPHVGGWYVTYHRTHPFEEDWHEVRRGGDLVPVGIGKRGLVYPPRSKVAAHQNGRSATRSGDDR